jgi:aryl-alcohol dehydrogenase-like predicted oxidoreductase
MANPFGTRILGRTGLATGPLGISASYGIPPRAMEMAFERGMNYFYWGSFRRENFAQGLRNLRAHRDKLILVVQSYSRIARLMGWSLGRALSRIGFDYADILLLGFWNHPVSPSILDAARQLQHRGLVRYLALSSHDTPLLGQLAAGSPFDVLHFRYNAVLRSAEHRIFPHLAGTATPGMVAYTATSWKQLLHPHHTSPGDPVPTAGDCYRFVLSRPEVCVCMTGTADEAQTRHALDAIERGSMTPDELAWMRRTGDNISGKPLLLPLNVR